MSTSSMNIPVKPIEPKASAAATTCASNPRAEESELVLLGTGVSTALPRISCILRGRQEKDSDGLSQLIRCDVCQTGLANPDSPNRRCNVSALVRIAGKSVLIDCGKTVREASMRFLPKLGVRSIDAVVLTHGHADAIMGLDDLRDIQDVAHGTPADRDNPQLISMPVWLNEDTMNDCVRCFPYLVQKSDTDITRRVASIQWEVFSNYLQPFYPVKGLDLAFTPIRLFHGGDYICAGFVIRGGFRNKSVVAYLSDVSKIPDDTMHFLKQLPQIDVLIIDSLLRHWTHSSHFSVDQAIELARDLRPKVTRCVGMTCSVGLHDKVNADLAKLLASEKLDFALGYDGLRLPL